MDLGQGGVKFDAGKVRIDLVPGEFIYGVAACFTYGAIKYDDWNWAKGMRKGRIMAALGRHWVAYMVGEDCDDESGLPHLWHMGCCVAMLTAGESRGVAIEDRQEAVESYRKVKEAFAAVKDPAAGPTSR